MNDASKQSQQETALAAVFPQLWERVHGTPTGNVQVLVGRDSVAIWIEGALTSAEHTVAIRTEDQPLMQRYVDELLAGIQPDMRAQVEESTGRRIVSVNARIEIITGHLLCFFVLGEPLVPPPSPGTGE